ncbi:MAG TPA: PEGA domain-containing protein [Patescibacteria group bacterium]|nr:PEGA domain-containing protein [Patescibacteria group bacterium]
MGKQILISLGILTFLVLGTVAVVLYGTGYRFGFAKNGTFVVGTGLLVATSTPDGAQVIINGHLSTATDNTINLAPGEYDVKIFKDGYFAWQKKITVQQEVVSKADATLFPVTPNLESITDTGVLNPILDPSETKIAYVIASQSATVNGIYVLDMGSRSLLTLQSNAKQILVDATGLFSQATLSWSPDGQSILASIPSALNPQKPTLYLLDANNMNTAPQDVTETFTTTIQPTWTKEITDKEHAQINSLPPTLAKLATADWHILSWSADGTKILYQASSSATIPQIIKPALIGTDSAPEERMLQQSGIYVYDTKEDKNFSVIAADKTSADYKITWLPDSKHLLYVYNKQIVIMDYDGLNPIIVYAGPFIDSSVFPWADPTKIVILTNLNNPDINPNLYTVGL